MKDLKEIIFKEKIEDLYTLLIFKDTKGNTKKYLIDNSCNKVNLNNFTLTEAIEMLNSLENCRDCIDCKDCFNCVDCKACIDCKDCINLKEEEEKYNLINLEDLNL